MKKVYIVGSAKHYANFITGVKLVDDIDTADIVMFTGGEDVTPALYGAKAHPATYCDPERDEYETEMFKKIRPDQFVVSICRGSQFVCVMNGGKLVQDVTGHGLYHTHGIYDRKTGVSYQITSTHHQMQYPYDLPKEDYDVLYIAEGILSRHYEGDGINPDKIYNDGEPEIVMYHKKGMPKCLAIQGHPEYMRPEAPVVKMINTLINSTLKTLK